MATSETKSNNVLEQFLNDFLDLTSGYTKKAIDYANDEDEKAVIRAFSPTLISQVTELNKYVKESVEQSSRQQIKEVNQIINITSGISLVQNAKGIFPSLGSLFGKLGLSRIVKEIKKIFRMILEALGIKLPKWLDALLNIIDEIFDAIGSAGSAKLATTFSIQEQNYLAELTQLAKLQQANQFRFLENDEDEI
ncbi:hypothetical protein LXD69_13185 [Flavobacterium sediminilitoris]|uniref:Uncharacterized protein n=1 Tax=Flavobacterium sediminilitoris TaxID=2024526 RepID=A0ABY4HKY1_9FLAO|nr:MULTISPECIES: hypothetical protein [Flavobacterium]UOX32987.1 hypothetical protein LXD69_13185 [Flavobacterium sediminilitoris]